MEVASGGAPKATSATYPTVTRTLQSSARDIERDPQTGEITVTIETLSDPLVFVPEPSFDEEGFAGHIDQRYHAIYFRKSTGTATIGLFSAASNAGEISGTSTQRWGDTVAPTSGDAVWSGDYLGFFLDPTKGQTQDLVRGDGTIVANFDDGSIAGLIENRESVWIERSLPDLVLQPSEIDDVGGALGDVRVDGNLISGPTSTYTVLIAGPQAGSAISQIYVDHASDKREIGVLLAETP